MVRAIEARFPGSTKDGAVDREALSALVLGRPAELAALEAMVHPAVGEARERFVAEHAGKPAVLFEIPLLFETGTQSGYDHVIVVSAPAEMQWERAMRRAGMTRPKLEAILARQMPDSEKRARADFVVDTSGDLAATERQVRNILACLGLATGR